MSDTLALSSTSRNMRTLFLNNASSIISAVCKNVDLLSAAEILIETIFEVAKIRVRVQIPKTITSTTT
ncbi:unnamed protein product [Aureobasidium mustum]|uniref:Uncharacterized protein n=1 Tax=Aureobasidium mustum TaxID=2773714 RepID=A0A9N8PH56_9PEZI|nr:unnamed protein product [Aureobasidium mustum]